MSEFSIPGIQVQCKQCGQRIAWTKQYGNTCRRCAELPEELRRINKLLETTEAHRKALIAVAESQDKLIETQREMIKKQDEIIWSLQRKITVLKVEAIQLNDLLNRSRLHKSSKSVQ